MIILPFIPGAFASTVEYLIRNFTKEYENFKIEPNQGHQANTDGSMHGFQKLNHIIYSNELKDNILNSEPQSILTPIYPFTDFHAIESLDIIFDNKKDDDKTVLLFVDSIEYAEINMLFQYHKISIGLNSGLDIICSENQHSIIEWNKDYIHWKDMQIWELREWLSIFYIVWVLEWVDVQHYSKFNYKISTRDILNNPQDSMKKILEHCGLTLQRPEEFDKFLTDWRAKQQYVLDEFTLINNIVTASINGDHLSWSKLNIISESIIQCKLRQQGYGIQCYMLNDFPTDSKTLQSLLEKE
jgi:hypothetical protein